MTPKTAARRRQSLPHILARVPAQCAGYASVPPTRAPLCGAVQSRWNDGPSGSPGPVSGAGPAGCQNAVRCPLVHVPPGGREGRIAAFRTWSISASEARNKMPFARRCRHGRHTAKHPADAFVPRTVSSFPLTTRTFVHSNDTSSAARCLKASLPPPNPRFSSCVSEGRSLPNRYRRPTDRPTLTCAGAEKGLLTI